MINKKRKKNKTRLVFLFTFFCATIGYLSYSLFYNVDKILTIKKEKDKLEEKFTDLKEEEEDLNSNIKKLKDPEYVARYAREKYMYSKEGELIIRIPED